MHNACLVAAAECLDVSFSGQSAKRRQNHGWACSGSPTVQRSKQLSYGCM